MLKKAATRIEMLLIMVEKQMLKLMMLMAITWMNWILERSKEEETNLC